ncbi:MAG: hypothetical protein ISEC1_P1586 [Thiomicrorhabdus sp.]|nr:MAG: hypothetical protein ISEC1_P1586 [Thiomicrorhabdus sp.]
MRLLSSLFLVVMAFSLTACGKKGSLSLPDEETAQKADQQVSQQFINNQQALRLISFQDQK